MKYLYTMVPNLQQDPRVVLTFDAGGTNFVFSALRGGVEILDPLIMPSHADDLGRCLETISKGFDHMLDHLQEKPVAISFAFPAPSDYPNGVIGDLKNLPGFRGGVPLARILEHRYQLPTFINNDGDLYAYGEALGGFLPEVNQLMALAGNPRRYKNLVGLTLGTGFGGGFVSDGHLIRGDNSIATEVWILSNSITPSRNAEEEVSIRAVNRNYMQWAGDEGDPSLSPKEIFEIASGQRKGNREAAVEAFASMGRHLGDVIANLVSLMDGLVVMGGGIAGAERFFMPALMHELGRSFEFRRQESIPRMIQKACNLNTDEGRLELTRITGKYIPLPGSTEKVYYDAQPKVGIGTSRIGTSRAISLGAYAFALSRLGT